MLATALGEAATGLALLVLPPLVLELLLGVTGAGVDMLTVARILGAALVAIGVACWLARHGPDGPAQRGILAGVLIYDVAAAALLAYAALALSMTGLALWPAAALHAALAVWCAVLLGSELAQSPS